MMFGHDDHQHHDDKQNNPASDGVLAPDNTNVPAAAPALPNDSAGDFIMDASKTAPTSTPAAPDDTVVAAPNADDSELLHIKQEAMQALSPLLDHLDQAPEEKFRTTMMMIQAADNDKLIPVAYEAAKAITDEKTRAQALLDIVNEINYFTQNSSNQ